MAKSNPKKIVDEVRRIVKKRDEEIKLLKTALIKANGEKTVSFRMPDNMEIRNFPLIQKVEITNREVQKVRIENQPETQKVQIVNGRDIKTEVKFPEIQKVQLINAKGAAEKENKWIGEVIVHAVKAMIGGWGKRLDQGIEVRLAAEERLTPLPVVMVDKNGRQVPFTFQIAFPQTFAAKGQGVQGAATIIKTGRVKVASAGTAVQFPSSPTLRNVTISTPEGNAGRVYIGDANVSAQTGSEQGICIEPTGSALITIDNLSKLYVDAANSNDVVSWTYTI
jgi:hypothetical protein